MASTRANPNIKSDFSKNTFYLDIRKTDGLREKLKAGIRHLNGIIEEFLSQRVRYVVTDRPRSEWPSKDKVCEETSKDSRTHPSVDEHNGEGCTNSPAGPINNLDLTSRGKRFLSKVGIPSGAEQQLDVLSKARKLGISIISAEDMRIVIEGRINERQRSLSSPSTERKMILRQPFIKIEDKELRTKPVYKELNEWPELNIDLNPSNPRCSPFVKRKIPPAVVGPLEKSDVVKENGKISKESGGQAGSMRESGHTGQSAIKRSATSNAAYQIIPKKAPKRKMYCEICNVVFEDLLEHVKAKTHIDYMNDSSNFEDLNQVIKSIPTIEELVRSNAKEIKSEKPIISSPSTPPSSNNSSQKSNLTLTPPSGSLRASQSCKMISLTGKEMQRWERNSTNRSSQQFLSLADLAVVKEKETRRRSQQENVDAGIDMGEASSEL